MIRFYQHLLLSIPFLHASLGVFFHELSHVTLKPKNDHDTFGFSLAYQGGSLANLVTGAPHSDLTGKVFKCPLHEVLSTKIINCNEAVIEVDKLAPYSREYEPNIKLNLGYSVSAKDDYLFTCAPLWTSRIKTKEAEDEYSHYSMGTCFVYNGTAHRYTGFAETLGDNKAPTRIRGGNGWRTMLDQENDLLVIAKVAGKAELTHVNASKPLQPVVSMMKKNTRVVNYFNKFRNLGFSIAAGKFFGNALVYAISALNGDTNKATIHFIEVKTSRTNGIKKLSLIEKIKRRESPVDPVIIKDDVVVGSMFGSAMCSANLNMDPLSDLLVGAPAQGNSDDVYEAGAVHIYLGGDERHINDYVRHRVIFGSKEFSRFGSAIAANDIDGDYLSEIFVSAPYEDSGRGALYIISGYELNKKLINTISFAMLSISQLELTQRIQSSEFKTFGYSLQVVPDIDNNGCDELAIGSPGSNNIMLVRCVPSLNVTIEANHIGNQTTVHDTNFTVSVCVSVQDTRNRLFPLALTILNEVKGEGAYIEQTKIVITAFGTSNSTDAETCENIIVKLFDAEVGTYFFQSTIEMAKDFIYSNDFSSTQAVLSPYSKLKAEERVVRQCKGSDCEPNLSMNLTWSGGLIHQEDERLSYNLGSSELLTANLRVLNTGNSSFDSCALVRVSGATVAKLGCSEDMNSKSGRQYKCYMPIPLKRNAEYTINIQFNMSQPTNEDEEIQVHVVLRHFCNKPELMNKIFSIRKNFQPEDLVITGSSQKRQISDTEIQDQRHAITSDAHEYWIENNGNVTWIDVTVEVTIPTRPYITAYRVSSALSECPRSDDSFNMTFLCTLTLFPRSKVKILASTDILKNKIMDNLEDNQLILQSTMLLYNLYDSYDGSKKHSISTTIAFKKEQSLAQNKNLIIFLAVLGAAIALILMIFILYKMKFFKRTEKTKLEELKQEHVRRQSVKRSMSLHDDELGLDMEVDDDSPFEIVDMETPVLPADAREK